MPRPLSPDEMFPAGVRAITVRRVALRTGVSVRVAQSGPANGVTVVMLPGWGASIYSFRHALEVLPSLGVRAIAFDQRGQGLSDKPREPYTADVFCNDLEALFDALSLARPILVGHSMGGGVALRCALRDPVRTGGVVLVNPTGLVAPSYINFLKITPHRVVEWFGPRIVPRVAVEMILKHIAYGDASLVTARDIDEYWAPTQLPRTNAAADAMIRDFDWQPLGADVDGLAVPAVVILGEADRLLRNAGPAAGKLPGAKVYSLRGGHCVHEERPEEVYRLVADAAVTMSSIK